MNNKKELKAFINKLIKEEMGLAHPDHEAKMAKAELRDMIVNGSKLYNMIQPGQELPGWVSGYITLASDYIHSVYEYMVENKTNHY